MDLEDLFPGCKEDPKHGGCKVKKRCYRQERLKRAKPLYEIARPYCTYDRSQRTRTIRNTCVTHQIHKTLTFSARKQYQTTNNKRKKIHPILTYTMQETSVLWCDVLFQQRETKWCSEIQV